MNATVLMFGWEFPPYNSGGLGVACQGLTKALASRGVNVTFVLPRKLDIQSPLLRVLFADSGNVRLEAVDALLMPYLDQASYNGIKTGLGHAGLRYGGNLFEEVERYARYSAEIIRQEKFDIIHAHDWLTFPAGIKAKTLKRKKLIAHIHSTEFDRTGGLNLNQAVYEVERAGLEQADRVVAVSNFTKNIVTRHYGINPDKVTVVYNGIDLEDYAASNVRSGLEALKKKGNKIVLFAGRITLQKGPDYFLKMAKKVLEVNPKVYFVMTGTGDLEKQTIHQAISLGISDKVIFTGFVRGEELKELYRGADLFVLPSVSEPFGIAVLEAVACNAPVLISKQSGVSEVLSHALKSDFWDIDDMADKILSALALSNLHSMLRQNSSEEVKSLTWHHAASQIASLYSHLIYSH